MSVVHTGRTLTLLQSPKWDRRAKHKVVFLDFDGVLHPESGSPEKHFCFMTNFCEAIESAGNKQDVSIVISSAWRLTSTFDQLVANFPHGFRAKVVGVTPDLQASFEFPAGSRQREIEAWMEEHAPNGDWLAVDDRETLFAKSCPNLFLVPQYRPGCSAGIDTMVASEFVSRLTDFYSRDANHQTSTHRML